MCPGLPSKNMTGPRPDNDTVSSGTWLHGQPSQQLLRHTKGKKSVHLPGVEPGSGPWQGPMLTALPQMLHMCLAFLSVYIYQRTGQMGTQV